MKENEKHNNYNDKRKKQLKEIANISFFIHLMCRNSQILASVRRDI